MSCIKSFKESSFASAALRRLGCGSSAPSDAFSPASSAVRSSSDCHGSKRSRRRRHKVKQLIRNDINPSPILTPTSTPIPTPSSRKESQRRDRLQEPISALVSDDFWYSPGFSDDDSMSRMLRHRGMMMVMGRGGSRHHTEMIHREIMMLQSRITSGRMNGCDRYRDWRLDVDRMSYEELLELGDRIGYVNTGLREEDISCSIRKMKHSILDASPLYFSTEMEKKCSICQEEYEVNNEIGKLECGHGYHLDCIKQWLLQKNACPLCKSEVTRS